MVEQVIPEKCVKCPINPDGSRLTEDFYDMWRTMWNFDETSVVPGCCKREDCPFKERYDHANVSSR